MSTITAHIFDEKWRSDDVKLEEQTDFSSLFLSERVLSGLTKAGFKNPSPIQLEAIPIGRFGKDLVVQAKSGTGKTLVFSIVALEMMILEIKRPQVLILAPTREIAFQICDVIQDIGVDVDGLTCRCFIGGLPVSEDVKNAAGCQIVVGTPGRVKQLITLRALSTSAIRLFIIDEADQLMDRRFKTEMDAIFLTLPKDKQVIATSATYGKELKQLVTLYFRDPFVARLNINKLSLLGIVHYIYPVPSCKMPVLVNKWKCQALENVLTTVKFAQCLVFCNLVSEVESLCLFIKDLGFSTTYISSAKEQNARLKAINHLKRFKCKVLVTSDVTSRGIDAENVDLIINFNLAFQAHTYLHRVGRAGRYGSKGIAITLLLKDEIPDFYKISTEGNFKAYMIPDPLPSNLINHRPLSTSQENDGSTSSEEDILPESLKVNASNERITKEMKNDPIILEPKELGLELKEIVPKVTEIEPEQIAPVLTEMVLEVEKIVTESLNIAQVKKLVPKLRELTPEVEKLVPESGEMAPEVENLGLENGLEIKDCIEKYSRSTPNDCDVEDIVLNNVADFSTESQDLALPTSPLKAVSPEPESLEQPFIVSHKVLTNETVYLNADLIDAINKELNPTQDITASSPVVPSCSDDERNHLVSDLNTKDDLKVTITDVAVSNTGDHARELELWKIIKENTKGKQLNDMVVTLTNIVSESEPLKSCEIRVPESIPVGGARQKVFDSNSKTSLQSDKDITSIPVKCITGISLKEITSSINAFITKYEETKKSEPAKDIDRSSCKANIDSKINMTSKSGTGPPLILDLNKRNISAYLIEQRENLSSYCCSVFKDYNMDKEDKNVANSFIESAGEGNLLKMPLQLSKSTLEMHDNLTGLEKQSVKFADNTGDCSLNVNYDSLLAHADDSTRCVIGDETIKNESLLTSEIELPFESPLQSTPHSRAFENEMPQHLNILIKDNPDGTWSFDSDSSSGNSAIKTYLLLEKPLKQRVDVSQKGLSPKLVVMQSRTISSFDSDSSSSSEHKRVEKFCKKAHSKQKTSPRSLEMKNKSKKAKPALAQPTSKNQSSMNWSNVLPSCNKSSTKLSCKQKGESLNRTRDTIGQRLVNLGKQKPNFNQAKQQGSGRHQQLTGPNCTSSNIPEPYLISPAALCCQSNYSNRSQNCTLMPAGQQKIKKNYSAHGRTNTSSAVSQGSCPNVGSRCRTCHAVLCCPNMCSDRMQNPCMQPSSYQPCTASNNAPCQLDFCADWYKMFYNQYNSILYAGYYQ